uniref:Uncharacterized protein n=1 Tax=Arundo donax TaxID=35708 RepID=A0A0A8YMZ1_ARUDO
MLMHLVGDSVIELVQTRFETPDLNGFYVICVGVQ